MPRARLGKTQPRLFTPPLRPLNRRTSDGYSVADFAEMIGEPLLPWERWAAIHALELLSDGRYRFRTVLILVARQNGKSTLKRIISLWRMFMNPGTNVLGTAQDVSLAREQWNICLETIRKCPALDKELARVRNVNGDEMFYLTNGSRYLIKATNARAGRGLSANELNIDELRTQTDWRAWSALSKTTMAKRDAQIWAMSNQGDSESVVLHQLRDAALSGRDETIGIFEWSAPDGCELDDVSAWQQANPALGYLMDERAIASALGTDPPGVFRTEVLCQQVDELDNAIDMTAWKDCADPSGSLEKHKNRLAACFDVSPDGKHATLAIAAKLDDGRVRLQVAGAWKSSEEARGELLPLLDKLQPVKLGWYPTGPGGAFAPLLRQREGNEEITGMRAAECCMGLADLAKARMVVHAGEPLLDAHVSAAQKLASGDGWRFTRRGNMREGHVDAAYAAAGAVWLASYAMPQQGRARLRWIN